MWGQSSISDRVHRMTTSNAESSIGTDWDAELVCRIGQSMRKARGEMSARELSERTAALGHPISPQVIARLDSNRRAGHLEVSELLVIAEAIGVSPASLLFPDGDVERLPGVTATHTEAVNHFIGADAASQRDSAWQAGVWAAISAAQDLLRDKP